MTSQVRVARNGRDIIAIHDDTGTCCLVMIERHHIPDHAPPRDKIRAVARAEREARDHLAALLKITSKTRLALTRL